MCKRSVQIVVLLALTCTAAWAADAVSRVSFRPPRDQADLKYWLQNMVWHHGFNDAEVAGAMGLSMKQVADARAELNIHPTNMPQWKSESIKVLPYPGGRHPRIGFQDGAVWPQRETKVSVFLPWDSSSYVVVDVPEAIWSNLGLTYLAHQHVPTIWDKQGVTLPTQEWERAEGGVLRMERKLPNGISFTSTVRPMAQYVRLEMSLHNGTAEKLSDLRVQMCMMLKGAEGFNEQTNDNKVLTNPYTAVSNEAGDRWIIFAFSNCHRPWGNPPCPCLHSDPKFEDLQPGETGKLVGLVSFYEGTDVEAEFRRLAAKGWLDERSE